MKFELVTERAILHNGKRVPLEVEEKIFDLMRQFKAARPNGANSPISDKAAFGMAQVALGAVVIPDWCPSCGKTINQLLRDNAK